MDAAGSFLIREATASDVPELRRLIEQSVRRLQKNDYTPEQIEGALGHALGLDTQLIEDGTYFVAEVAGPTGVVGCRGGGEPAAPIWGGHPPARRKENLHPPPPAP